MLIPQEIDVQQYIFLCIYYDYKKQILDYFIKKGSFEYDTCERTPQ